jgi:hypothetical protein
MPILICNIFLIIIIEKLSELRTNQTNINLFILYIYWVPTWNYLKSFTIVDGQNDQLNPAIKFLFFFKAGI